jgi:formyltetrahydrofolate deformylase
MSNQISSAICKPSMSAEQYIVVLSCLSQPGIVSKVGAVLYQHGGNILEAHQFDDKGTGSFFMRMVFNLPEGGDLETLIADFRPIAESHDMRWEIRPRNERMRVLLMVSRRDHCLADLLRRWRMDELKMDIVGIVSNHPRSAFDYVNFADLPFHYLPVTRECKSTQEARIKEIISESRVELVVLAGYTPIPSEDLASFLWGRCINIQHSFLPAFNGARSHAQTPIRGVKFIGATAHYVTGEVDEGPVIEQDVERVGHQDSLEELVRKARNIESRVLARAVASHLDGRTLISGATAVVFRDERLILDLQ